MTLAEQALRAAVERHEFAEIERLAAALCEEAAAEAGGLQPGDPRAGEIAAHVDEVLEWCRVMLCTVRARWAEEIRTLPFVQGYLRQESPGRVSVEC